MSSQQNSKEWSIFSNSTSLAPLSLNSFHSGCPLPCHIPPCHLIKVLILILLHLVALAQATLHPSSLEHSLHLIPSSTALFICLAGHLLLFPHVQCHSLFFITYIHSMEVHSILSSKYHPCACNEHFSPQHLQTPDSRFTSSEMPKLSCPKYTVLFLKPAPPSFSRNHITSNQLLKLESFKSPLTPSCPSTCGQSVLLTAALWFRLNAHISLQPLLTNSAVPVVSRLPLLHTAHSYSPISPHGCRKVSFKVSCAPLKLVVSFCYTTPRDGAHLIQPEAKHLDGSVGGPCHLSNLFSFLSYFLASPPFLEHSMQVSV